MTDRMKGIPRRPWMGGSGMTNNATHATAAFSFCAFLTFLCFIPISHAASDTGDKAADKQAAAKPLETPASSGGLTITDIRKEGDVYSATLNGSIVLKNLTLKDGKLFFPQTGGKDDKQYFAVYLDDRSIADQIKEAIKAGKASGKGKPADITVTGIKWKEFGGEGKLKGFADVTFNKAVTVKGCKLLESKNGLWLAWPSVKKGKEYDELVFVVDKALRDRVFEAVKKEAGTK